MNRRTAPTLQKKILHRCAGFLRCFVQDRPPAARRARRDILRPVIKVNNFRAEPKEVSDFAFSSDGSPLTAIGALDGQLITEKIMAEPKSG